MLDVFFLMVFVLFLFFVVIWNYNVCICVYLGVLFFLCMNCFDLD